MIQPRLKVTAYIRRSEATSGHTWQNPIDSVHARCAYRPAWASPCGLLMTDPWASVEDIGEHPGVSKDTIYAWIAKRNMPVHRVGQLWKSQHSEVDAWIRCGGAAETIDHDRVYAHKAQQDRTA